MAVNNGGLISGHKIIVPAVGMAASTGDIEVVLGVSSGDLATLCQSRYINKWAKYKPISYSGLIDTTSQLDSNNQWKSDSSWWQGSNGQCGFEMVNQPKSWASSTSDLNKNASTLKNEANALDQWFNNGWNYAFRPWGSTSSPYRQADFNYYDHNAVAFVKSITEPSSSTFYAGSDSPNLVWTLQLPTANESKYSLGFGDIRLSSSNTLLSNYHFGLIFVNVGSKFPGAPNFLYRKYVIVNSAVVSNSNGKSITLTGAQTAMLTDNNNPVSQQDYKVYPILVSSSSPTSMSVFGTTSLGNMVVIPNSKVFNLSLVPNELEGNLQGGELENVYSPVSAVDYTNNDTYISIINRSNKTITVSSVNLSMEIWEKSGSTYQKKSTVSSGYALDTSTPFTMAAGSSKTIHVSWTIDKSNFTIYRDYLLRETGTLSYTKSGGSGEATLLANPPYEPNSGTEPKVFQAHITVDTVASTYFYVNIWAENVSGVSQSFNWGMVVYDVVSYEKTATGTDYDNPLNQTNVTITGTNKTIAKGGVTDTVRLRITPRYNATYGYFASVTVHGGTVSGTQYNVGTETATANY